MMDFLYKACTPTDCVLILRLNRLRDEPKKNKMVINCQYRLVNPSKPSARLKATAPMIMMRLLLKLASRREVMGMVAINPIGMAKSAAPNCASFRCRDCCIEGMRDAQVV